MKKIENPGKRTLANRLSAQRSRDRKKKLIEGYEREITKLSKGIEGYDITALVKEISNLKVQLQFSEEKRKELEKKIASLEKSKRNEDLWIFPEDLLNF